MLGYRDSDKDPETREVWVACLDSNNARVQYIPHLRIVGNYYRKSKL